MVTKQLVVNADDFGFTRDINAGIIEAHRDGILTATTLMATGGATSAAFDDAVRLARETPSLDIGCHLVLVGAPGFPPTIPRLVRDVALGRIHIYGELVKQVRRIVDAGLSPTHLDTHKHTHLLPPVLEAVARISEEFRIPWVRRPFDFPLQPGGVGGAKRAWTNKLMRLMNGRFSAALTRHRCRSTDWFAGFRLTGRYRSDDLVELIRALPEGVTEFMCHPGRCGDDLRAARTRLKESREEELRALISPEVRAALADASVKLVSFRELTSFESGIPRKT
ncbi:MAG: ChbG/HpnK family deacetylase [Acidobacteriia bacterium]|nr:ChbG/HpnK family deacetylase [Terriglobia bacterium]